MQYASLGATGLKVSQLAFGAGPVAGVMIGNDSESQVRLVRQVLDAGINWVDTAAAYGDGRAEQALGNALAALGAREEVHVATKVRLRPEQLGDITGAVRNSLAGSLKRLGLRRVTLLQLHNSLTEKRGEEPDSITPGDVLDPGGVLEAFKQIQLDGLVKIIGITGIGQARMLHEVVNSGQFNTIQVPYSIVNPSAGQLVPKDFPEANYGEIIKHAAEQKMGVFAIRIYAGGVLAGNEPSMHTRATKYFPMDLFERDKQRVARFREMLPVAADIKEIALRFAVSHRHVTSAVIGFSEPQHVDDAVKALRSGPLPERLITALRSLAYLSA